MMNFGMNSGMDFEHRQANTLSVSNQPRFSQGFSKADDTFAAAKSIGTLRASSAPVTLRAKGKLGVSDRVDFYKFTISPGTNFPSYTDRFKVSGGRLKAAVYVQHPILTGGEIQLIGSKIYQGQSSAVNRQPTNNDSFAPITIYVKATLVGKATTQYDFKTTYNLFE